MAEKSCWIRKVTVYVLEMHVPSEVIYIQSLDFKFSLYKKNLGIWFDLAMDSELVNLRRIALHRTYRSKDF